MKTVMSFIALCLVFACFLAHAGAALCAGCYKGRYRGHVHRARRRPTRRTCSTG